MERNTGDHVGHRHRHRQRNQQEIIRIVDDPVSSNPFSLLHWLKF